MDKPEKVNKLNKFRPYYCLLLRELFQIQEDSKIPSLPK